MRILLATAAALAPLVVACGAHAEVVISTARTTPILTSNATGTAADNIRLATGGSITVATGAAVTVDSNNAIDLDSGSSITMNNTASGSTGIMVNAGTTGAVTVGGTITLSDGIEANTDTDNDGDLDGAFADGTGRYGVRVAGTHTGDIVIETGGSINVQGNQSTGLSIEGPQTGQVRVFGNISMTGTDTFGVRTTGPVTGDVLLSGGTVGALGQNAVGLSVEGDVSGRVQIQSSVGATGYRYTTAPGALPTGVTNGAGLYLEDLDADDLLQGGSAVRIAANVAGGILLDTGPVYLLGVTGDDDGDGVTNDKEDDDGDGILNGVDTDRDGDGILDTSEGTANLTVFGGAPALAIGSATGDVTIGAVGTGANAFGLINRGAINAYGIYSGVSTQAVQIGQPGGGAVTIAGGINNSGTIGAQSFEGSATGLNLSSGATAPTLVNGGTILAQVRTTGAIAPATAVMIEAGAGLTSLNNDGTLGAVVAGDASNAYGVRDLSGTLTTVTNSGLISAVRVASSATATVTGANVALDLAANTTGVTVTQFGVASTATTADPDTDGDGVTDSNEPLIRGDIRLGTGADTLDIRNGAVIGAIAFGAGADRLDITGGATVTGALSDTDGLLDVNVANGVLTATQGAQLNTTSLNVGTNGTLVVSVDPASGSPGGFKVNGAATLADGSKLGVRFNSLLQDAQRFTIIDADTLNYGAVNTGSLQTNSPYLYVVSAGADVANANVYIDARRRTAAEAGLIPVEASAFDVIYGGLSQNAALQAAFLSETTRDGFINLYEQTLPDHSGGPLQSLSSGVDAVTRALTGRNASAGVGETSAWVQEINFYADKDKTDTYGYRSEGFGVAGGVERGTTLGSLGVSLAFTSSDIEDPEAEAQEILSASLVELGLYWRAQGQNWTTWARAAGGYAKFDAKRSLVGDGLYLNNESNWDGFTLALAGGASYERNFGKINIRPEVYAEYFSLHENARTEAGGGNGFDLDIDERDGHLLSGVAAVNIGYGFGTNGWIRPELRLGWRQNFSSDLGQTTARFVSGGNSFTLSPEGLEGGGPIAGFRLSVGNQLGMLSINADAEMLEDYVRYTLLLRASFRF